MRPISESDPNGKCQHEPGAKLDGGKLRPALFLSQFPLALTAITEVAEYGAQKYTPNGWKEVPDGKQRYTDALVRHWLFGECIGEHLDRDSGLLHAAHLAWNALARLEFILQERMCNDTGTSISKD